MFIKYSRILVVLILISACDAPSKDKNDKAARINIEQLDVEIKVNSENQAVVSWKSIENANQYVVYWSRDKDFSLESVSIIRTKQSSVILENLSDGDVFYVKVSVLVDDIESQSTSVLQHKIIYQTPNTPPVANAGSDKFIIVNESVNLDGSQSYDSESALDALNYSWSVTVEGGQYLDIDSINVLSDSHSINPIFMAKKPGLYTISLVVNDGEYDSAISTVNITVSGVDLKIINSIPNNLETNWGINNEIEITFNEEIDPLSIKIENIKLTYAEQLFQNIKSNLELNENNITGNIRFSEDYKTIYFSPDLILNYGTRYKFILENIKLNDSRVIKKGNNNISLEFSTTKLLKKQIEDYTGNRRLIGKTTFEYDNQELSKEIQYKIEPLNGTLDSQNLILSNTTQYSTAVTQLFRDNGDPIIKISFNADGSITSYDALVSDDGVFEPTLDEYQISSLAYVSFDNPGDNALWGDNDDNVLYWYYLNPEIQERLAILRYYRGESFSGRRFENRHEYSISIASVYDFQESGLSQNMVIINSFGDNGVLDINDSGHLVSEFEDDEILIWIKRDYDNFGRMIRHTGYHGNGLPELRGDDNKLYTDDDKIISRVVYSYLTDNEKETFLVEAETTYNDPGQDLNWDTLEDNTIDIEIRSEYDENLKLLQKTKWKYSTNLAGDITSTLEQITMY